MSLDTTADVIVVGGGLAGLSITYQLTRLGVHPFLIEAGPLFSGTSGACAGRVQILDSHPGSYLDLVLSGFNYLRRLGDELECDLEWREPGHLGLIQTQRDWDALTLRVADLRQRGVPAEMVNVAKLQQLEPYLAVTDLLGAALAPEGHLNPFRLYEGLAQASRRLGARLITHAPMTGIAVQQGRVTEVVTSSKSFSSQVVILACGAWTGPLLSRFEIGHPQPFTVPLRFTQAEACITEPLSPRILHHVGMADFYQVVHGDRRKIAFGVGQHLNGTMLVSNAIQPVPATEDGLKLAFRSSAWGLPALAQSFHNHFPSLAQVRIMRTWSAPSPFLPDYQPVIGWANLGDSFPSNLYLAAGFHLAIPTIAVLARLIASEITNNQAESDLAPYRPDRWISKDGL